MVELNTLITNIITPLPPLLDESLMHPFGLLNDRPAPLHVMAANIHKDKRMIESLNRAHHTEMPPYIGSAAAPCDISPLSTNDMSRQNDEDENPEQDLVADLSPNGPPSTRRARRTPRERPSIAQSLDFTAAVMTVVPNDDMTMDDGVQEDDAIEDSNSSHSEIGLAIDMQDMSRVLESGSNVDSQEDESYNFSMNT